MNVLCRTFLIDVAIPDKTCIAVPSPLLKEKLFSSLLESVLHCFGHFWPTLLIFTLTAPRLALFALLGFLIETSGYYSVSKSTCLAKAVMGTTESNTAVVSSSNVNTSGILNCLHAELILLCGIEIWHTALVLVS